jgi:hypothetical protein
MFGTQDLIGLRRRALRRPTPPRAFLCIGAALLVLLACAPVASAADSIYWGNENSPISHAALDGSGGADLAITGSSAGNFEGEAIDPATETIYWTDWSTDQVAMAPLAGGTATPLKTAGATIQTPEGIAIDPAAGKVYWASEHGGPENKGAISYANLDGSGGAGDLNVTGAQINSPWGIAIDLADGRIYWGDGGTNLISYANLDGSGGGVLTTTGAPIENPEGIAIDQATGKIYWANESGASIAYANLDGSGGGVLKTTGAVVAGPTGLAIDLAAGRIYWADEGTKGTVASAALDGSGGGATLKTTGATTDSVLGLLALLKAPSVATAATVTGATAPGSTLACAVAWAADAPEAQLYRAPRSVAYSWLKNGVPIAGAAGSTLLAAEPGGYACRSTATNAAGSSVSTSAALAVAAPPPPPPPLVVGKGSVRAIKVVFNHHRGTAVIVARVSGPGTLNLAGAGIVKRTADATGAGKVKLTVRAKGAAARKLLRSGRAKVKATITFRPTLGAAAVAHRQLTLRRDPKGA